MRKLFIVFSAAMFLSVTSTYRVLAQQSTDIPKEIELIKKTDKKMQYNLSKCAKDMKVLNQKMDENLKNLNVQMAALITNVDSLDTHFSTFKADVTKNQDQLNSRLKTLGIRLWLCVFVLLLIAAYIFFGVIGAIKKNKMTAEAMILNEKEAFAMAIRKVEKEMNDKFHTLEQQIAGLKK
jgi:hypothetical protein